MTLDQELEALGLKKNEVKVYLAVLELGEPLVGEIERQTHLHKQLIYIAAKNLQERGLFNISQVRGRKRFSVTNPSALEEQERDRLARVQELTPKLFAMANQRRAADQVRIYRGAKGVQQHYLQSIRSQPEKSTVHILGVNSERYFEIFKQDAFPYEKFERTRIERKVTLKLLLFGPREQEVRLNRGRPYIELRLMSEPISAPIDLVVWHDRVALLFFGPEPYLLDIVGQETVRGFREYFDVLWKQGESVPAL